MKLLSILLAIISLGTECKAEEISGTIQMAHSLALEAEVTRLKDMVNMLYAQIKAMQSEARSAEAKAAEKAAIEKRSKELGCEVEVTTGACKPN